MNKDFYPHRSALYMPGSNERALEKAKTLSADLFIFDFEDSVSPEKKEMARDLISRVLTKQKGEYGQKKIITRVNSIDTKWGQLDIEALENCQTDGILFPKVNDVGDIKNIRQKTSDLNLTNKIEIWIMVETPKCILNLQSILEEFRDLKGIVVGTNDLAKDIGLPKQADRFGLIHSLATIVLMAKAYNVLCLDGVYNRIGDEEGLSRELFEGKRLGYDGKTLIHPSQITKTNEIFSPSDEEIEIAEKYINAFKEAEKEKKGVITVDGVLVEELHVKQAKATLEKVKFINQFS
tara:strand:+ start:1159 stop:2037 length:879 start_codon:yes stop_codon:yes gene_type:complete